MSTTNYDVIAEEYKRAKQQPWRSFIESFTLMELIGDLSGKAVVDLACGEGFYTRMLRQRGAMRVVGVDLSERMIDLANAEEARHPLGIDYLARDVRDLSRSAEFDLVVAAYLLNYARDREELREMCEGVAHCLRPGGRFVTVLSNPDVEYLGHPTSRKYGFETRAEGELREGTPITWTFFQEAGSFQIENYHLDVEAHERAFRVAGLRDIRWHRPRVSPAGEVAYGRDFWSDFLDLAPVIFNECVKEVIATCHQAAGENGIMETPRRSPQKTA